MLIAGLVLALCAAPSRAEPGAVDKALVRARAQVSEVEALRAQADAMPADQLSPAQAACRKSFSIVGTLRELHDRVTAGTMLQDMRYQMLGFHSLCYYQCIAYASNDRSLCSPLNFLKITTNNPRGDGHFDRGDYACRDHIDDVVVTKALLTRSPETAALCFDQLTKRGLDAGQARQVCAIIVDDFKDPAKLCSSVRALHLNFRLVGEDRKCEPLFRGLNGDTEGCKLLPPTSHSYERCFEYAAFVKAYAAQDITLCGDHPLCRVMMGGGAANCADYVDHMTMMVCGGESPRAALLRRAAERGRDALALLAAASKGLPAEDSRLAEIDGLRRRCRQAAGL